MSRLDAVIGRLKSQRSCLNAAVALIGEAPGHVLELGLGNGRTYDHLRLLFPNRNIYVFDATSLSGLRFAMPVKTLTPDSVCRLIVVQKTTIQILDFQSRF